MQHAQGLSYIFAHKKPTPTTSSSVHFLFSAEIPEASPGTIQWLQTIIISIFLFFFFFLPLLLFHLQLEKALTPSTTLTYTTTYTL